MSKVLYTLIIFLILFFNVIANTNSDYILISKIGFGYSNPKFSFAGGRSDGLSVGLLTGLFSAKLLSINISYNEYPTKISYENYFESTKLKMLSFFVGKTFTNFKYKEKLIPYLFIGLGTSIINQKGVKIKIPFSNLEFDYPEIKTEGISFLAEAGLSFKLQKNLAIFAEVDFLLFSYVKTSVGKYQVTSSALGFSMPYRFGFIYAI